MAVLYHQSELSDSAYSQRSFDLLLNFIRNMIMGLWAIFAHKTIARRRGK